MKKNIILLVFLFLIGCQTVDLPQETEPETSTSPVETETSDVEVPNFSGIKLVEFFPDLSFSRPLYIAFHQEVPYIVEQAGRILNIIDEQPQVFLDIRDRVNSSGNEQGLLGFALDPDFTENNTFYVNYTYQNQTRISRFIGAEETVLLTYDQPYSNHNGGHLEFGPDGYLYIGSGDGGGSGDPQDHAQNTSSLLGKILRIDVSEMAMRIPEDNPFNNEVFAYGLRNPWRFSFDSTGMLYVGDVGQNAIEEINIVELGKNYGWSIMEGTHPYRERQAGDLVPPIYEYHHSLGQAITGGYVYEGELLGELKGYYIYGDFLSGRIWALKGQNNYLLLETSLYIASFGRDEQGELYVVDLNGAIYQFVQE